MLTPTAHRVASSTDEAINREIASRTEERVERFAREEASPFDLRLGELKQEWDIERTLQFNAGTLALAGLTLGVSLHRGMLGLPALVGTFLLQHALQGWCPPVPVLRRLQVRTPREIQQERQALKVLRGDYARLNRSRDAAALLDAARR